MGQGIAHRHTGQIWGEVRTARVQHLLHTELLAAQREEELCIWRPRNVAHSMMKRRLERSVGSDVSTIPCSSIHVFFELLLWELVAVFQAWGAALGAPCPVR